MANGSGFAREVRITLPIAIGILGTIASTAAGLFAWHSAQRERLEDRLLTALGDTAYVINQRSDRQDIRRRELYTILNERMNRVENRTTRMETLVLERALESLVRTQIQEELPPVVQEELPGVVEEVLEDAP